MKGATNIRPYLAQFYFTGGVIFCFNSLMNHLTKQNICYAIAQARQCSSVPKQAEVSQMYSCYIANQ